MSGERQKRIKRALAAVFGAAAVLVVLYILRPPCLVRCVIQCHTVNLFIKLVI